jgi:hypothetical protein
MKSTWFLTSVWRIERKLPVSILHSSFLKGIGGPLHRLQAFRRRQGQHPADQSDVYPVVGVGSHGICQPQEYQDMAWELAARELAALAAAKAAKAAGPIC